MTEQQQDPAPRQQFQQMFKEDEDRGMQITQWKSIPKCKSSQYQSPPAGELLEFSKNQKEVSVATEEGERGRIKGNCWEDQSAYVLTGHFKDLDPALY